jgi:hypothetical protein
MAGGRTPAVGHVPCFRLPLRRGRHTTTESELLRSCTMAHSTNGWSSRSGTRRVTMRPLPGANVCQLAFDSLKMTPMHKGETPSTERRADHILPAHPRSSDPGWGYMMAAGHSRRPTRSADRHRSVHREEHSRRRRAHGRRLSAPIRPTADSAGGDNGGARGRRADRRPPHSAN